MEKYEVIHLLGEGSFGRVYKAKQIADSTFVALKVISKRGRSTKEIKGLRRECEIQRHLHHPNIIQMLDSFETENEIVVITEFAHKQLNVILDKKGYLPENCVQKIVWDLVSALYYLHSNRVLHRDLKPQNILLDSKDRAKLCDFGFARNMSTGTHVLTSIKGTPLYMAPELIQEQPYDHNADLWSLGCIIYQLLVGAPPFCTASILNLIRIIQHENIQWPNFISDNCISFLKGLLQKNPSKRMTWPQILNHPFVEGHILISEENPSMPLTRPLSANTLQVKEQQKNSFVQKAQSKMKKSSESGDLNQTNVNLKESKISDKNSVDEQKVNEDEAICEELKKMSVDGGEKLPHDNKDEVKENSMKISSDNVRNESENATANQLQNINIYEDFHPMESEEWIVFLLRSIEEVMNGELASLCQQNLTNIIVSPLRNANATPKVLCYVSNLLSLPFTVSGITDDTLEQVKKVYFEVKLVPNLVYASKLLMREKAATTDSKNSSPSPTASTNEQIRSVNDLEDEELQALEYIYLLICHLVHIDNQFLNQFCDSVVVLNVFSLLNRFLHLIRRKLRIVVDLIAILTQVLRNCPENGEIVERVLLKENEEEVNFVDLLRHSSPLLRERVCYFFLFLVKHSFKTFEIVWNPKIKDTIEALVYDSMENVRNAAEKTIEEMKFIDFYNETAVTESSQQCASSK